jgi:YD repeat-containing protein
VRTETAYDLRGGTVEQRLPTFSITSGLDPITATFTIGNVSGPANPSAIYQQVVVNYGYGPITTYIVNPTATLAQGGGYYSNGSGQYVQDPNHQIVSAVRITWGAPSEAGIQATFEFRVLGSSDPNAWSAIPVGVLSGNTLGVNVQSLTNTTYEYRARYKRPTEAAFFAEATGSFRVDGTTTSSVSISQSPPDPAAEVPVLAASYSNAILTWTAPTDTSVTATFRIKPTTSGTFTDVAMTRSGANFTVNLQSNTATAGTYDFEVVYTRAGSTIAKRTGQLSSNGQGTLRTVTSSLTDTSFAPTPAAVATVTSSVGGQVGATIASSQHQTANLTGWAGTSSVVANWANIGSGQVKVELDYTTQDWEAWNASHTDTVYHDPVNITNKTFTFATGTATTGATLSWTTTGVGQGGITAINAIRVYREMSPGVWSLVYSQTSPTAVYGRSLSWASASGVAATFEYAVQGTGSWTSVPIITGSTFGVDLNAVANGTYDYRITYRVGNRMTAQKIGVLTITSSSVSTTVTSNNTYQAALIPGVTVSSDTISWSYAMLAGSTVTVRYTIGGTLYTKSAVGTSPNFSMQFAELPTGTSIVAYNIDYYRPGETDSYARASGSVNATVTLSPIYPTLTITSQQAVYPSGLQQIAAPTDLGSNFIGWTTAASGGATILFQYQPSGGGTWTTLPTQVNGTGYKVDLTSAAAGTYNYYIAYTASGQVNPYAVARGTFTITRTSSITGFTVTPNAPASPATSTAAPRLQQTFDRWGNVLSVTDAANQTTNYRYNQFGAQVEVKQPSLTVYSTAGGTLATTIQRPTSYNYYDNLGRLIGVRDANGNLTKAALNAAGQVLTENHPDSGVKTFTMNIFGNQTVVTDELGFRTWSTYNGVDLLTAIQHEVVAGGQTYTETYSYDGAGRRISFTNGENETTKYFYDLLGNVVTQRSALNNSTTYEYDTQNRKTKETNAIAGYQTWTYNYFGRLDSHRDLGAIVYTYTYNSANLLTAQTSTGGENQSYTYDAAGHLTQINDTPAARVTTYAYDTAGRRAREKTKINNISTQDTAITYDALGHLSKLTDLRYSLTYLYDAQGNRTNINAVYYDHDQAQKTQDLWYTYDSMNRVLVSQGVNTLGAIGINTTQGIQLTYDLAGQRKTAYTYGTQYIQYEERDVWNPNILDDVLTINYNLLSRYYTDYFSYDGVGRLTKIERDGEDYSYFQGPSGPPIINVTQHRFTVDTRTYDNASRQTSGSTAAVESNDLAQRNQTSVFDDDGRLTSQTTTKSNGTVYQTESVVTYNNDAASVLRGYTVQVYNTGATNTLRYTSTYSNNYRLSDSYQDAGQTVSSSGTGAPQNGSTTRSYNADNELISFTDSRDATKNRYFENSQTGQPLLAVQGNYSTTAAQNQAFSDALSRKDNATRSQYFFFANGQAVGSFGQLQDSANAFKANFDVNYTPVSSDYPASVPTQVIAQQNETLRTIAARVYGDASLWYLIAEENGLTNPDALLESGTALRIPNEVVSLSNSSTSFKPFDVRQAIGDTTPTQPAPKPKKGGCGILGQILILVVAIVATVFTAGALAAPIGSSLGTIMAAGSSVMLGGVTVAGVTAVGTAGAFFATAAVAGAVGSIVSQGVAIAIGAQDSFSWKQVALAGIQAGVGAGLGASGFAKAVGKDLAFLGRAATPATIGVTAATSNALVQGIAVATGVQSQFSWRNVAISAVSAPIAHYGGNVIGNFFGGGTFATGVASSVVGASVRSAFGGKIDVASVLADAFGNALANSVVRAIAEDALVRRQNAMRAQLAESNPDLLGMYDRFIRSGGDPAAFDAVVRNETSRNALTNLAQLEASADHIVASGVDTKDVWTQELGQPDGADGYTLDIDGKPTRIQNRETYGMQALNALADLQVGINELRETVPIDQLIMAAQVAVMGPAAFALDYAKGLLVESIAGDYIRSGVNGFATVLNAGAHETNYDTVRFLLENRNRFEEMWSDSYDLHDELAQRDAGRLIDLSGDLDKSQTGAKLLAAGLLMGTAAMLAMRRGGGQPEVTLPNSTRGWRVGDPVNNLTSAGNVPSWATVRSRYWKNEALTNAAEWSEDNVARMQSGLAPQRMNPYTGELESMELNHVPAQRDGGLFDVEQVWPDDHAAVDPFRQLGRPPHTPPSGN